MQPVGSNVRQRTVVENDNRISILRQSSHREDTVVRMNHDVACVCRVWENRVCLDDLLGEAVVEPLEEERAKTGPSSSGD